MTMQNHWGKWVDTETPVTGVIGFNDLEMEYITDEMYYHDGINLSYEAALDELSKSFVGKEVWEIDRMREDFDEHYESYPDDEWLIGSWKKDESGLYEPDETGEFAAIVRENVVQVVWSKTIVRVKNLCSPCYPGQADLDPDAIISMQAEHKGFLCYSLPLDFFRKGENENV